MSISDILTYFALGYAALTIFFFAMSLVIPQAGFAARGLASYVSLVIVAAYGVFASIFLTLIGKQGIAQWAVGRSFHYLMLYTTGVEFVIEDPDNVLGTTRPAVFVGNHQTELDVLMLGRMFPKYCSVTAKASLKKIPFLGWFMSLSGSIFIDRKNSKDAREAMKGAASEIQSKRQSVYMFPEGTRSYAKEPMLLPFKKGAFHLAVQAGVPIVPCVVANYSHVLYPKTLTFNSGKIPMTKSSSSKSNHVQSSSLSLQRASPPPTSTSSPAQRANSCSTNSSLSQQRPVANPWPCQLHSATQQLARAPLLTPMARRNKHILLKKQTLKTKTNEKGEGT
jgi:lysophosphatidate acyltransferase